MNIKETYNHLLKFKEPLLSLGKPILDNRLEEFEKKYEVKFTAEFVYLYKKHNGFGINGIEVFGLGEEFREGSLDKYYELMRKYFQNFIPKEFVPISPDGAGNYYCLDLSRATQDTCPIVFYQHDYEYLELSDIETCNNSFAEWINEVMIGWTLREYDYDGNRKDRLIFKAKKFFNKLFGRVKSETSTSNSKIILTDNSIDFGAFKIYMPDENGKSFWISEDLADLFGTDYQSEAFKLLKSKLKDVKPKPSIEYEADSISINSSNVETMISTVEAIIELSTATNKTKFIQLDKQEFKNTLTEAKNNTPKSKEWNIGDVFSVPLSDNTFAFGQVLNKKYGTCALFDFRSDLQLINHEDFKKLKPISILHVGGRSLNKGHWKVLSNEPVNLDPNSGSGGNFEEVGSSSYSAGILTDLAEAFWGIKPWNVLYKETYYDEMLLNGIKRPESAVTLNNADREKYRLEEFGISTYKIEIQVSMPKSDSSDSVIRITKDGIPFKTINSSGLTYSVTFDFNSNYLIECSKKGFTTKVIYLDTYVTSERQKEEFNKFSLTVELFEETKSKNVDTSKPVGGVKFNIELDDFDKVKT